MATSLKGGINVQGPTDVFSGYSEILKFPAGLDAIKSVVLDASSVAPDGNGVRKLVAGTLLRKSGNQYVQYTGAGSGSAVNEVQTATISGSPTGGTFTLTFEGDTTDPIAYNATALTVQNALVALPDLVEGDVTVTGSAGGPYTITFGGQRAGQNVSQITAAHSFTGGTTPSIATATTTAGVQGAVKVAGVLGIDVEFADGSTNSDTPAPVFFQSAVFRSDRIVDFGTHGAAAEADLVTCKFE